MTEHQTGVINGALAAETHVLRGHMSAGVHVLCGRMASSTYNLRGHIQVPASASPYPGECVVTPSNATQVFSTAGHMMTNDFVVNPIPSNYGLITYNGYDITVS